MDKLSRSDVLRKCIVLFEAIRRTASKGNAGLVPERGAEESFYTDSEILRVLREMLRDLEAGEQIKEFKNLINEDFGGPLHCFIIPSKLHFMEAEYLVEMAGAPKEILNDA